MIENIEMEKYYSVNLLIGQILKYPILSRIKILSREFPGVLVVRTLGFHCHGLGSIPSWGTEILPAVGCGWKKKKRFYLIFFTVQILLVYIYINFFLHKLLILE